MNRFYLNDLPNERVLSKPQHSVPRGRVTGRDGDRPRHRRKPPFHRRGFPRPRPGKRPLGHWPHSAESGRRRRFIRRANRKTIAWWEMWA